MKKIAGVLLLLMTIVLGFCLYLERIYPVNTFWWLEWLKAFSEAAMIGALADWFAVTALFRRPLGLPIPHTAVIPSNKERIGLELGNFIKSNFLTEDLLRKRIEQLDFSSRMSVWLQNKETLEKLSSRLATFALETLKIFDNQKVRELFEENLVVLIDKIGLAPAAGNLLDLFLNGSEKEALLDSSLKKAELVLNDHQALFAKLIKKELPWWVPGFVHDRIYGEVFDGICRTLKDAAADPTHPIRVRLLDGLQKTVQNLKSNPQYLAEGEKIKNEVLKSENGKKYFEIVAVEIKEQIALSLKNPESGLRKTLYSVFVMFGDALIASRDLRERINAWFLEVSLDITVNYRDELSKLISETVNRWDSATISDKIEKQMGKDLQFIRVNGTIVGGLIGLLLHFVIISI